MSDLVERFARDVLRSDAGPLVPLSRLHGALIAEAGAAAGSYGQLYERLRRRPELFELVEPPPIPWDADVWPESARRVYQDELRRVGAVAEPRVRLRDAPAPAAVPESGVPPLLRRLEATLLELWAAVSGSPGARDPVAEALALVDELRAAAGRVDSTLGS